MKTNEKTKWVIDVSHSKVGFKVKHLMIANVLGTFREFDAQLTTDGDDFTTAVIINAREKNYYKREISQYFHSHRLNKFSSSQQIYNLHFK